MTDHEQVREAMRIVKKACRYFASVRVLSDDDALVANRAAGTIDRCITAATAPTAEWDEAIAYFTEGHAVMERQKGVPLPKGRAALATLTAIHTADRAEVERLRAENSRLTRIEEAARRIQFSDRIVHGKAHSDVESPWGDVENCDLCALRAALSAEGESCEPGCPDRITTTDEIGTSTDCDCGRSQ